jgi:hypothetical protein
MFNFDTKNLFLKKIYLGGSFFLFNFVFVAVSFLVLLYLIYLMSNSGAAGIVCIYKFRFGIECPTCGYTRSFIHYLKFDFKSGISQNNSSIYYYIFATYFAISRLFWVIFTFFIQEKVIDRRYVFADLMVLILFFCFVNIMIYIK